MNIEQIYGTYPDNLIAAIRGNSYDEAKSESATLDQRKGLSYALCMLYEIEEDILLLRYRFNQSFTEIAVTCDMSEEEVKEIIREAIHKLRYYQYTIDEGVDALVERLVKKRNSKAMFEDFMKGYRLGAYGIDEEEKNRKLEIEIEEASFSIRTYNCLKRAGVNTVGDLLKYDNPESITGIRNLSRKCILEVAKYLFIEGVGNDVWETFIDK